MMMIVLSAGAEMTRGMMYRRHNPRWWRRSRPLAPAQSSHLSHYGDSGDDGMSRAGTKMGGFLQHTMSSTKNPLNVNDSLMLFL